MSKNEPPETGENDVIVISFVAEELNGKCIVSIS